jgi:hypothetical protein
MSVAHFDPRLAPFGQSHLGPDRRGAWPRPRRTVLAAPPTAHPYPLHHLHTEAKRPFSSSLSSRAALPPSAAVDLSRTAAPQATGAATLESPASPPRTVQSPSQASGRRASMGFHAVRHSLRERLTIARHLRPWTRPAATSTSSPRCCPTSPIRQPAPQAPPSAGHR